MHASFDACIIYGSDATAGLADMVWYLTRFGLAALAAVGRSSLAHGRCEWHCFYIDLRRRRNLLVNSGSCSRLLSTSSSRRCQKLKFSSCVCRGSLRRCLNKASPHISALSVRAWDSKYHMRCRRRPSDVFRVAGRQHNHESHGPYPDRLRESLSPWFGRAPYTY